MEPIAHHGIDGEIVTADNFFQIPRIMGVLNVTPDSFSDGGAYPSTDRALARALEMVEEGATLIDIGGESTRPGSDRVDATEQKRRILDVVEQVGSAIPDDVIVSVDTTLSEVARAALDAGAGMVNDISAGRDDPGMFPLIAERGVPCCLMHMQGTPKTMQDDPQYSDAVGEVREFLAERAEAAQQAGVEPGQVIVDPGIGFGKRTVHNLQLIAQLNKIVELGYPVLLGTSRKRFMGEISGAADPGQRMPATVVTTGWGLCAGARIFRVHDVWQNRQALDLTQALLSEEGGSGSV